MANKRPDEQNTTSADATSASSSAAQQSVDAQLIKQQNEQIAELKTLISDLGERLTTVQAVSARDADFKAAVRSVETAAAAVQRGLAASSVPGESGSETRPGVESKQECGCGPCDCLSDRCCMFEVMMTHVRVIDMQIEPGDTNVGLIGPMEIRMFAAINGIGTVIPNLFGTISLAKLLNKPGVWNQVNRSIGNVSVCKGKPKTITISVDAVEVEEGVAEQLALVRDEYGTADLRMVLDCCCSLPSTGSVEIHLTGGGQGGGTIESKFSATRICC